MLSATIDGTESRRWLSNADLRVPRATLPLHDCTDRGRVRVESSKEEGRER